MEPSCFCRINELGRAIAALEHSLLEISDLTLNEAMVLCCLSGGRRSAGELAVDTGIKASHLSKLLRSIEDKGLLTRAFGSTDKRVIYFDLTLAGAAAITALKTNGPEVPALLKPFLCQQQ